MEEESRFNQKLEEAEHNLDNLNFKVRLYRWPLATYLVSVILFVVGIISLIWAASKGVEGVVVGIILAVIGVAGGFGSHKWLQSKKKIYREMKKTR
jgi:amino acid permease